MTNAAEVLDAIVRHTGAGGTLQGSSPLIALAAEALANPVAPPARFQPSPGLTPAQLAMRQGGIGASETPMLANVSPFGGPIDLYLRKVGLADEKETDAQKLGNFLEEGIIAWYEGETGASCTRATTLVHRDHPWFLATPDRWVNGRQKIAQVKLVGSWMRHHWSSGVPEYVQIQVQQEMEVADVELCDVVVVLGGTDPKIFQVERDREFGAALIDLVRGFWFDHVVPREPPPVDGSKSAAELLKKLYPIVRPVLLRATAEIERWAAEYANADADADSASKRLAIAEQNIKAFIGDAEGVSGNGWSCTWKANVKGVRSFKFNGGREEGKAA